jgi:putative transposase
VALAEHIIQLSEAMQGFRDFMKLDNDDKCLDEEIKLLKTDGEVRAELEALMKGNPMGRLQGLDRKQRQEILKKMKESEGVSLRQIARVTGLSLHIVFKA